MTEPTMKPPTENSILVGVAAQTDSFPKAWVYSLQVARSGSVTAHCSSFGGVERLELAPSFESTTLDRLLIWVSAEWNCCDFFDAQALLVG
mmetsp:Transcript_14506/g.24028  ORF Transcript_14506/g.24028 Transcript_14506/m.24028 type:complete len:91 (+) Transcript_14506:2444-2716(+)